MVKFSFLQIFEILRKFEFPANYDFIVGITKGGVIPAVMVAHQLQRELSFIYINYRDKDNNPRYTEPKIIKLGLIPKGVKNILLVDDASVSGKTLKAAKKKLVNYNVKTLVFKGRADYVLLSRMNSCIDWPWTI